MLTCLPKLSWSHAWWIDHRLFSIYHDHGLHSVHCASTNDPLQHIFPSLSLIPIPLEIKDDDPVMRSSSSKRATLLSNLHIQLTFNMIRSLSSNQGGRRRSVVQWSSNVAPTPRSFLRTEEFRLCWKMNGIFFPQPWSRVAQEERREREGERTDDPSLLINIGGKAAHAQRGARARRVQSYNQALTKLHTKNGIALREYILF